MKHISLLFLVLSTSICFAQKVVYIQESQVEQLANNCQTCLDKGKNKYGCTVAYYQVLDSCLKVAYKQVRDNMYGAQQQEFKLESLKWLRLRDQKFKAIDEDNTYKGKDVQIVKQNQKNAIVKERILFLIKKAEN